MWQLMLRKIAGEAAADMLNRAAFMMSKKAELGKLHSMINPLKSGTNQLQVED